MKTTLAGSGTVVVSKLRLLVKFAIPTVAGSNKRTLVNAKGEPTVAEADSTSVPMKSPPIPQPAPPRLRHVTFATGVDWAVLLNRLAPPPAKPMNPWPVILPKTFVSTGLLAVSDSVRVPGPVGDVKS